MTVVTTTQERQKQLWPHLDLDETPLPTCWSPKDKYSLLDLSHNNLRVHYKGQGKNDGDAAAVRANHPIPAACGLYYFEVRVVSKGRDGYIGIGFTLGAVSLNRLPGWEKNSYGYHGDDGHSFCSSSTGSPYGPTFTTGDIIGCCINFVDNTCFYTKNGVHLGVAFRNIKGKLYPTVGLRTPGEVIEVNFGQEPFEFDFEGLVMEAKQKIALGIETNAVTDERLLLKRSFQSCMTELITSYLVHYGYSETGQIFAQDTNNSISEPVDSIRIRQTIRQCILNGDLDQAIALSQQHYPLVLQSSPALLFKLKCRKFIELVRDSSSALHPSAANGASMNTDNIEKMMAFGQELQLLCDTQQVSEEDRRSLEEAFSLLAYPDPSESPVAYLLQVEQREPLAVLLNSALLASMNLPSEPPLEKVLKQASTTLREMLKQGIGAAAFISLDDYLPK